MRIRRHTVVLLVVGFLLAVSTTPASAFRGVDSGSESRPAARNAMDLFRHLESLLRRIWSKNGCHIDPLGRCVTGSAQTSPPDNGTPDETSGGAQ